MHEQHTIREPDEHFDIGTLAHLVIGNEGRVLDGRRTPGFIEHYDAESAMFIWRITAFEDSGKCWEIPAEQIDSYQFRRGCPQLSNEEVTHISKQCQELNQKLNIQKDVRSTLRTEVVISKQEQYASDWIKRYSSFYHSGSQFDFHTRVGIQSLYNDLEQYLREAGLYELEIRTAEDYLLNPYSGEWIKGMQIVMAEMGLISYNGTCARKPDTFSGIGTRAYRSKYIIARIAFIRSIFKLKGITEIPVYRGMSSENDFHEIQHSLLSTTLSLDTAMSFADIRQSSRSRSAYIVKFTCPVDCLFMTFFETKQFSERYQEQEAVILYDKHIQF